MAHKKASTESDLLRLWISVNNDRIKSFVDEIVERLKEAITKAVAEQLAPLKESPPSPQQVAEKPVGGVEVPREEQMKAADLRTAVLMGKVPEDAGLLLDSKATAKLLSISRRTFATLQASEATPEPVRLGQKIVRWRLAEILAWIEADCPPRKHWTYTDSAASTKRRK